MSLRMKAIERDLHSFPLVLKLWKTVRNSSHFVTMRKNHVRELSQHKYGKRAKPYEEMERTETQ